MPRSSGIVSLSQDQEIAQLVFHPFFRSLGEHQRRLIRTAVSIYLEERRQGLRYPDYTFVVFSMSKAYEGFLKEYLFTMRLLDDQEYKDRRFRIGRALNPDVSTRQRDDLWLYDDLVRACSSELARELWNTWLECRNQLFHYFPGRERELTLLEAGQSILRVAHSMQRALLCEEKNGYGSSKSQ